MSSSVAHLNMHYNMHLNMHLLELIMETLLSSKSASLTELREAGKVLDRAGATPVAIMNRNVVVAYLVPIEAINMISNTKPSDADLKAILASHRQTIAPVLKYLEDK